MLPAVLRWEGDASWPTCFVSYWPRMSLSVAYATVSLASATPRSLLPARGTRAAAALQPALRTQPPAQGAAGLALPAISWLAVSEV
jgi:hypothetical protein